MLERGANVKRVLPCLLDRLTDNYPKASKESREYRALSLRQYRDSVIRDLGWLLNCTVHMNEQELEDYDYARTSVLSYGVRCLSGLWASDRSAADIEASIRQAIQQFEPRILPGTLEVKLVVDSASTRTQSATLVLEISGELWAEPLPEHLYIKTQVDLETGKCNLS